MLYYAILEQKGKGAEVQQIRQHVGTDEAADRMLAKGYTIIAQDTEGSRILATPEDGWITERPVILRTFSGRS